MGLSAGPKLKPLPAAGCELLLRGLRQLANRAKPRHGLFDVERQVVAHALARHRWNISAAARALGVPRHVLAYRIEKYGLERDG